MTPDSKKNTAKRRVYDDRSIDGPNEVRVDSPFLQKKMEGARKLFAKTGYPSLEELWELSRKSGK